MFLRYKLHVYIPNTNIDFVDFTLCSYAKVKVLWGTCKLSVYFSLSCVLNMSDNNHKSYDIVADFFFKVSY